MKNELMDSTAFGSLGDQTKRLINQGVWFLYKIDSPHSSTPTYLLVVGTKAYFIDSNGNFSPTSQSKTDLKFASSVYFKDLPQPESLSNRLLVQ